MRLFGPSVAALCLLSLTYSARATDPSAAEPRDFPKYRCRYTPLPGWAWDDGGRPPYHTFVVRHTDGALVGLVVREVSGATRLEDVVYARSMDRETTGPDPLVKHRFGKFNTFQGGRAYLFGSDIRDGAAVAGWLLIRDGYLYQLQMAASGGVPPEKRSDFDAVIAGFSLTGPPPRIVRPPEPTWTDRWMGWLLGAAALGIVGIGLLVRLRQNRRLSRRIREMPAMAADLRLHAAVDRKRVWQVLVLGLAVIGASVVKAALREQGTIDREGDQLAGLILTAAAIAVSGLFTLLTWRCPICAAFLGMNFSVYKCRSCRARLQ
jgi:hypothetical protein